ncbi:hypothetical protein [Pyrolobus fumarii]|uniref:hypothetical protein n=1 Tax=Pyrolobus fumarii TaxID=54252 RepID=UPI00064F89E3|nr:hypothetical protein [Pyrolobus fumarii]
MQLEFLVEKEEPLRVMRVVMRGFEFRTPAVAVNPVLAVRGGHGAPAYRVTLAPRDTAGSVVERLKGRLARLASNGPALVESVIDFSLCGECRRIEALLLKLGEAVASECPDMLYCLPPIVLGVRSDLLLDAYMALLEGYWGAGGAGTSLPLYDTSVAEKILSESRGGILVLDAGRRGWATLAATLRLVRGVKSSLVYVVNAYRGSGLPRPAYDLAFFVLGIDVLGYSKPSVKQLAAIHSSRYGVRPSGLEPGKLVYVRGGEDVNKAAPVVMERVAALARQGLNPLDILRALCENEECERLLKEVAKVVGLDETVPHSNRNARTYNEWYTARVHPATSAG